MVVIPLEPSPDPHILPGSVGVLPCLLTVPAQPPGCPLEVVPVLDVVNDAVDCGGPGHLQLLVAPLEVLDVPPPSINDNISKTGLDELGQGQESVAKNSETLGKPLSEHGGSVQPLVALIALKKMTSLSPNSQ